MKPSFESLVAKYHTLVMNLIYRYYGGRMSHQAEDLAQEVWTKLWQAFKKNEQNVVNFKSYLYRTVQTTMWDAMRTLEKEPLVREGEAFQDEAQAEAEPHLLRRLELDKRIKTLRPEEQRMIRAHLKGFSNQEIALLLHSKEGRVRNLLTRLKKKLALPGE